MMRPVTLLYGTGNPAKLDIMRARLHGSGIELVGLCDMEKAPPAVDESGSSPLENARLKALAYFDFYKRPVFSCDSGLYFDNVPEELQPGINVRTVRGKRLSDEEMLGYYTGLVKKYGRLTARYKNAVCLVLSKESVFESMDEDLWGNPFYIVEKPHPRRVEGFPLDSISVNIETGRYYYDMERSAGASEHGFKRFFEAAISEFKEEHHD